MECDSTTYHTECNDEARVVPFLLSLSDPNNSTMTSKFLSCKFLLFTAVLPNSVPILFCLRYFELNM